MKIPTQIWIFCVGIFLQHYTFLQKRTFCILCENFSRFVRKATTMFVDEGFGSLDEETLRQAMQALSGLSENNRLVGIISHVAELRSEIDKQLVVTKEKSGGSKVELKLN